MRKVTWPVKDNCFSPVPTMELPNNITRPTTLLVDLFGMTYIVGHDVVKDLIELRNVMTAMPDAKNKPPLVLIHFSQLVLVSDSQVANVLRQGLEEDPLYTASEDY